MVVLTAVLLIANRNGLLWLAGGVDVGQWLAAGGASTTFPTKKWNVKSIIFWALCAPGNPADGLPLLRVQA
jgi:hypothetical protein